MVTLVRLAAHECPPENEDGVWVSRDSSSRYRCVGSTSLAKAVEAALYAPSSAPEIDLNVIVQRAREWADARNVATLYLSELPDAKRP